MIERDGASMAKLVLDLHEIYNRSDKIEGELNRIVQEAITKRIALVEIIPGKGSGQLKKHVLRFLNQGHIRALYHRIEKDDRNFGRIFIHFRH
jgi:dsDNA-specific endonuclease/ATPase MutS2